MEKWFVAHKLSLNLEKKLAIPWLQDLSTSFIQWNLYICNTKVKNVKGYKYFGVYIDDQLKWDLYIDYVYRKLVKFVGIFINCEMF